MAVYKETTTPGATRPPLRVAPIPRDVSRSSSHRPSRVTGIIAGVLAVVVGAWGGIAPYIGHAACPRVAGKFADRPTFGIEPHDAPREILSLDGREVVQLTGLLAPASFP